MTKDLGQTSQSNHPSAKEVEHPSPQTIRGSAVDQPGTAAHSIARISQVLKNRPDLDMGRPEHLRHDAEEEVDTTPAATPKDEDGQETVHATDGEISHEEEVTESTEVEASEDSDSKETPEDADDELSLDAEQLSEILGVKVTVTEDGELRAVTKVDGKNGEVTLNEALKGYQTEQSLTRRAESLAERERGLHTRIESVERQLEEDHSKVAALLTQAQTALNPYAGVNWQALRDEDPAQYGAAVADYQRWEQTVQSIIQNANGALEESRSRLDAEKGTLERERHDKWAKALVDNVDGWGDDLRKGMESYLKDTYPSMSAEDMFHANTHWAFIDLIRKGMAYDKGAEALKTKKVKKLPKVTKPQARKPKNAGQQARVRDARGRFAQKGDFQTWLDWRAAQRSQ